MICQFKIWNDMRYYLYISCNAHLFWNCQHPFSTRAIPLWVTGWGRREINVSNFASVTSLAIIFFIRLHKIDHSGRITITSIFLFILSATPPADKVNIKLYCIQLHLHIIAKVSFHSIFSVYVLKANTQTRTHTYKYKVAFFFQKYLVLLYRI